MKIEVTETQLPEQVPMSLETHVLGAYQFSNPEGGAPISFLLVSKNLESRLPGFTEQTEGTLSISEEIPEEYDLYFTISEEVPEKYRPYFIYHEFLEFTEFRGQPGRCRQALMRELALVPECEKAKYIAYRRNFFGQLLTFLRLQENTIPAEFLAEIEASFKFLDEW